MTNKTSRNDADVGGNSTNVSTSTTTRRRGPGVILGGAGADGVASSRSTPTAMHGRGGGGKQRRRNGFSIISHSSLCAALLVASIILGCFLLVATIFTDSKSSSSSTFTAHNQQQQLSNTQSKFNCHLSSSSCKYFYPYNFFYGHHDANNNHIDTSDNNRQNQYYDGEGRGKKFLHLIQELKDKQANQTLWNYMPAIDMKTLTLNHTCIYVVDDNHSDGDNRDDGVSAKTKSHTIITMQSQQQQQLERKQYGQLLNSTLTNIGYSHPSKDVICMTERITYLHMHKAGGTSMKHAMATLNQKCLEEHSNNNLNKSCEKMEHRIYTPSEGPSTRLRLYERSSIEAYKTLSQDVTTYPNSIYAPNQHILFTLVRDPTERFLSSIGQVLLGTKGSLRNKWGKLMEKSCVIDSHSSKETLRCLAQYVQRHGFWIELHFTPQAIELLFATMYVPNIPIAIFSFEQNIQSMIHLFLGDLLGTKITNKSSTFKGRSRSTQSKIEIIKNLSMDDYDDDILRIVCNIYEMDVLMMRSLGMEVPNCDPFLPK